MNWTGDIQATNGRIMSRTIWITVFFLKDSQVQKKLRGKVRWQTAYSSMLLNNNCSDVYWTHIIEFSKRSDTCSVLYSAILT